MAALTVEQLREQEAILRGMNRFRKFWRAAGAPFEMDVDVPFAPGTCWRFDFGNVERRIGVELRVKGKADLECRRLNAAVLDGWRVFRFTEEGLTEEAVRYVVRGLGAERI